MRVDCVALWLAALCPSVLAQQLSPLVESYLKIKPGKVVLRHVRIIDGTGSPVLENQDVFLANGKIARIAAAAASDGCHDCGIELDLTGRTIFPGIVGMHNHLFYMAHPVADAEKDGEPPRLVPQMTFTSPRLYLAAGVTTMRTTGSVETYTDLNLRDQIDANQLPGPHMDVTGPYLEGKGSWYLQMHQLKSPEEARESVSYWAAQGVTSFKAYMNITRAELKAAIDEAHAHGLKLTGHLCSVTYPEAVELGIDNLEHGFYVNTQLDPGKKPDLCPDSAGRPTLEAMDPNGPEAKALFALLISHHVAVTSTLPVFEVDGMGRPPLQQRVLDAMSSDSRQDYLYTRNAQMTAAAAASAKPDFVNRRQKRFEREQKLERAFAAAGGTLLAGPDPTGDGHVLPGFGDQRELELLVQAGFTPLEAIKIATYNGALYEGKLDRIGSIAAGKNADLVVVQGDPSKRIEDIENVEIVFRDGLAFDPGKLLASVKGRYGQY